MSYRTKGMEEMFKETGKAVAANIFISLPRMNLEEQKQIQSIAEKCGQKLYPPDYLSKNI